MIVLFICFGSAISVIGGSMIVAAMDVKREMRIEKMEARKREIKIKKMQKKLDRWNEADRIIESIKIESE